VVKKKPRTKLFIDKRVQGMLVRQMVFHWLIAATVMFMFLFAMEALGTTEQLTMRQHFGNLWAKYAVAVVGLVFVFPVFLYDSIKLSHRFAGPMISFRNAMKHLANGETIQPVKFRKHDFWTELTGDLNAIAKRMELLNDPPQAAGK
jgi:hypothetical protein